MKESKVGGTFRTHASFSSSAFSPSPLVLGAIDLGRELAERGQRAVGKEVDGIEGMYTKLARWGRNNGATNGNNGHQQNNQIIAQITKLWLKSLLKIEWILQLQREVSFFCVNAIKTHSHCVSHFFKKQKKLAGGTFYILVTGGWLG